MVGVERRVCIQREQYGRAVRCSLTLLLLFFLMSALMSVGGASSSARMS